MIEGQNSLSKMSKMNSNRSGNTFNDLLSVNSRRTRRNSVVNQDVDAFLTRSDSCLYQYFDWLDIFKVPIPSFNLNGKTKSGSSFGIIATIAFIIIFINYGGLKIIDFYN
jgi:hypothetical protein